MRFATIFYCLLVFSFFFAPSSARCGEQDSLLRLAQNSKGEAQVNALLEYVDHIYYEQSESADSLAHWALRLSEEQELVEEQMTALYLLGKSWQRRNNFDSAIYYFDQSAQLAELNGATDRQLKALFRKTGCIQDMGDFAGASETALKALEIAEAHNDSAKLLSALNIIGEVYREYARDEQALQFHQRGLAIAKALGNVNDIARSYSNISIIFGRQGENQIAIDTLLKALSILLPEHQYGRAKITSNLAFCYRNIGDYEKALEYNRKSLAIKRNIGDVYGIVFSLDAIGRAHRGLMQLDSAIYYIRMALDSASQMNQIYWQKDFSQHLSDAYEANEQYDSALHYFQMTYRFDDQIYETETLVEMEELERKYNVAKKEQKIERLEFERQAQANQTRFVALAMGAALLLLILISIVIGLQAKRKEAARKMIALKLETTEKENRRNRSELAAYTTSLMQKNKQIKQLNEQLQNKENELQQIAASKSEELEELSKFKILTAEDWGQFKILFERVHPGFFDRLNQSEIPFTNGEKRLAALIKLDLGNQEIADTLGISAESVSKSKFRLRKKMESQASLEEAIHGL